MGIIGAPFAGRPAADWCSAAVPPTAISLRSIAKTANYCGRFKTIRLPAVRYMVDGVQYIALQSGWGVDAQKMVGPLNTSMNTNVQVPQGGVGVGVAVK